MVQFIEEKGCFMWDKMIWTRSCPLSLKVKNRCNYSPLALYVPSWHAYALMSHGAGFKYSPREGPWNFSLFSCCEDNGETFVKVFKSTANGFTLKLKIYCLEVCSPLETIRNHLAWDLERMHNVMILLHFCSMMNRSSVTVKVNMLIH